MIHSAVGIFAPQKVSQGVDCLESSTEISIKFCETNCLCEVGAINRFSEELFLSVFVLLFWTNENGFFFPPEEAVHEFSLWVYPG